MGNLHTPKEAGKERFQPLLVLFPSVDVFLSQCIAFLGLVCTEKRRVNEISAATPFFIFYFNFVEIRGHTIHNCLRVCGI